MPTAAQQYVLIQEQMQREAKLGGAQAQQYFEGSPIPRMDGLVLVRDQNSPVPLDSASTRFASLKNAVSFSSYPSRTDGIASPLPPTVGGSQFTYRNDADPLKCDLSSQSRFECQRGLSVNGISSSASADVSASLPLSPHVRRVSFEKRKQFLTSEELQALRRVEEAADKKQSVIQTKESKQRSELEEKIQNLLLKFEKEEQKQEEKRKALEEKNEIKALKKECRRELKAQKSGETLDASTKGPFADPLLYVADTPLSTKSLPFRNSSFSFATTSNATAAVNLSFSKKKRKSVVDRIVSVIDPNDVKEKKKHVIEGPPFPYTAPKYVSKNVEKEILLQPMAFAPPPRKKVASGKQNEQRKEAAVMNEGPSDDHVVSAGFLTDPVVVYQKQDSSSPLKQGHKKDKNESFFAFGKKKGKKDKKSKDKHKDDIIVRGSLAASGNTGMKAPAPIAKEQEQPTRTEATPEEEVKETAPVEVVVPPATAPKPKLTYFAKRSKMRQQQIYRINNYRPSQKQKSTIHSKSKTTIDPKSEVEHATQAAATPRRNLTNVMYTSYYKPPKYIAKPEERLVLGQPTEITLAEKVAKKKRGPSKWEEEAKLGQSLFVSTQSLRKATYFEEEECRKKLLAEYQQLPCSIHTSKELDAETEHVQEAIPVRQEVQLVGSEVAVSVIDVPTPSTKVPNGTKDKKKKKFWHMMSCSKRSAIKTEKN